MRRFRLQDLPVPDLPLCIELQEDMPWENVGTHAHEFLEIVIFLRGRTRHVVGRRREVVGPGDVLVLRPGEAHGYEGFRNLRLANVHVDPRFLMEQAGDLRADPVFQAHFQVGPHLAGARRGGGAGATPDIRLSASALAEAERLVVRLRGELADEGVGRALLARALFLELLVLLVREGGTGAGDMPDRVRRVAVACAYLESNYREPLTLGQLAKKAGLSVNGFLRIFREMHGTSPIAYMLRLRLSHARKRLQGDGLSITEVAFESGFDDSNYFSRCYRKAYGESPSATRRRE